MIVADTSVWVDFFRNTQMTQVDQLAAGLRRRAVLMGDLILTEILQGIRDDREFTRVRSTLSVLPFEPMVGRDMAMLSAANYRKMRAAGVTPRKTIDVLIATFCIERGHILLYSDRDFDPMQRHLGLRVL